MNRFSPGYSSPLLAIRAVGRSSLVAMIVTAVVMQVNDPPTIVLNVEARPALPVPLAEWAQFLRRLGVD